MPLNGYNVGRDISIVFNAPDGPKRFSKITRFSSKQETTEAQVKGLDGQVTNLRFFEGWSGMFDVERQNSLVDDYFAQLEDNYFQGLNEQAASIQETIQEVDGSINTYRYEGVVARLADAGDKTSDKTVKQSIEFKATRRRKV